MRRFLLVFALIWEMSTVSGRSAMKANITLKLERTRLLAGESTPFTIRLTSLAGEAPDPEASRVWPKILVEDLGRGGSETYGPQTLESRHAHSLPVALPDPMTRLEPQREYIRKGQLLQWIAVPGTGRYDLTAQYRTEVAPAVPIEVAPARLAAVASFGSHSGTTALRQTLATCPLDAAKSALLLTTFSFDAHDGHAHVPLTLRVGEVDGQPAVMPAVAQNNEPYPAQWLAWIANDTLSTLYVKQAVGGAVRTQPLSFKGGELVGPGFLDLEGTDGTTPGRAEFAIWHQPSQGLGILHVLPDGSTKSGPGLRFGAGTKVWGHQVTTSAKARRITLAFAREGQVVVESTTNLAAPKVLLSVPGEFVAAGEALAASDEVFGAMLVRQGTSYQFHRWGGGQPMPLRCAEIQKAIVEVSKEGLVMVLAQTATGWVLISDDGSVKPLTLAGTPVGAFWLNPSQRFVLLTNPQRGLWMASL